MQSPDETEPANQAGSIPPHEKEKELLSLSELQQFADLLIQIRSKYDPKLVDSIVDSLGDRVYGKPIHGQSSYDRYIADISLYLQHQNTDLLFPWTDRKTDKKADTAQTDEQRQEELDRIELKIQRKKSKQGKRADHALFDFKKETWIRDFMADLITCFVKPGQLENGRRVLKNLEAPTRIYTVYYWHWINYVRPEKPIHGRVVTGTLSIYGDWSSAEFAMPQPEKPIIIYRSYIRPRLNTGPNGWGDTKNYYIHLREIGLAGKADADASELTLVLAVRNNNPDNTLLTGTFTGTDPTYGCPVSGRVCLLADTWLLAEAAATEEHPDEVNKEREALDAFARNYVVYQTTFIQHSSVESISDIPNFQIWRAYQWLFSEPLHGYFYKATVDDKTNQVSRHLVHFRLVVDPTQAANQPSPAMIEYDGEPDKANKGYITVEQTAPNGLVVFRGEFDYLTDQQRFRLQIQFTRSASSTWYLGTIMGLSRNRKQLLMGRFALRQQPLAAEWLSPDKLGELLLQHDQILGAFLLEIDQQIPSETIPLYNQLGWPHIPRIEQAFSEVTFDSTLAGEYGCYALIRVRSETVAKSDSEKPEKDDPDMEAEDLLDDTYQDDDDDYDDEEEKDDDQYLIARYPLKIFPDGKLEMKFSKKDLDGKVTPVQYHGRAFHQPDAGRLFLYFDTREMGKTKDRLHVSMYFEIKPNSKISRAFGVSNRFINTEFAPEARMEVLATLKGSTYQNTNYRTYDPFSKKDLNLLNNQSRRLGKYLSGRANRLILPYTGFRPDDSKPVPTRRKAFRRLHIRAALYELEHGEHGVDRSIKLLRNAYLHGFGIKDDFAFLTAALAKSAFTTTIKSWPTADKAKLTAELERLWPKLNVAL